MSEGFGHINIEELLLKDVNFLKNVTFLLTPLQNHTIS